MREQEGVYRFVHFLRQLVVGALVFLVALVAFGYFVFMRQLDVPSAWHEATQELKGSVLRYGEVPMREAHVYLRRPTNYFRGANGVLAATRDRLLYVGVEPKDQLASADAPPVILTSEFVNDTLLTLTPERVYMFTAHGVVAARAGRNEVYAAVHGYEGELDSLVAFVNQTHLAQRRAAAEERALRARVAEVMSRPLWYEVKRGDALSSIAKRFGTTAEELQRWNHLAGSKIRVRDTLLVRLGRRGQAASP